MLTMEYIEQTHEETYKELIDKRRIIYPECTFFKVYFICSFRYEDDIDRNKDSIGMDHYFLFEFENYSILVESDGNDLERINYLKHLRREETLALYYAYLISKGSKI